MTPPTLHGEHPPGIASPHLRYGQIGAFDAPDLEHWARLAEALMPELTLTIGLGASFFAVRRDQPVGLRPLPAFAGDALDEARCGGTACVLVCSDEPHDVLGEFGEPRWTRSGERTRCGYDTPQGLLFLASMKDPRRQFVPLQQRLSTHDALHPHTTARGSAVFAVPRNPLLYAQ